MDNIFKDSIRDLLIFDDLTPEQVAQLFTDALNEVEEETKQEEDSLVKDIEEGYGDIVDLELLEVGDIGDLTAYLAYKDHPDWDDEQVAQLSRMIDEGVENAIALVDGTNPIELLLNKIGELYKTREEDKETVQRDCGADRNTGCKTDCCSKSFDEAAIRSFIEGFKK